MPNTPCSIQSLLRAVADVGLSAVLWPESGLPLLWAFVSGGLTVWYAASVWAIDPHEPFDENGRMPKAAKSFSAVCFTSVGCSFLVVIAFIPPTWLGSWSAVIRFSAG